MATMTVGTCPCGETGTLIDGRCAFCERIDAILSPAPARVAPRPRPLNELMAALVAELHEDGVPDPLAQPLTLGAVWLDLARLAGDEPPSGVVTDVLSRTVAPVAPDAAPVVRGSYADPRRQFPARDADGGR